MEQYTTSLLETGGRQRMTATMEATRPLVMWCLRVEEEALSIITTERMEEVEEAEACGIFQKIEVELLLLIARFGLLNVVCSYVIYDAAFSACFSSSCDDGSIHPFFLLVFA